MGSNICVLGWGSLIWDPRDLKMDGEWEKGGPVLPIELSRKSKRGNLSLVIDEKNGASVSVRFCKSGCASLAEAIENLRVREDAPNDKNMGYIDFENGAVAEVASKNHATAAATIRDWGSKKGFKAVVWTALPPNFPEMGDFSPAVVRQYLESLQGEIRNLAYEYIRNAPDEVRTPARECVADLVGAKPPIGS